MNINNGDKVTEQQLRNRYMLLRNRLVKRTAHLQQYGHLFRPAKVKRWEQSIIYIQKEINAVISWMEKAQRHGGFIIWTSGNTTRGAQKWKQ